MKMKTMMIIAAISAGLFGILCVAIPGIFLATFAITLDAAGTVFARLFGAEMLGFAVLSWFARSLVSGETGRAVALGYVTRYLVGFIVVLVGMLQGLANPLGWSIAIIFLLLGLGFLPFLSGKKNQD